MPWNSRRRRRGRGGRLGDGCHPPRPVAGVAAYPLATRRACSPRHRRCGRTAVVPQRFGSRPRSGARVGLWRPRRRHPEGRRDPPVDRIRQDGQRCAVPSHDPVPVRHAREHQQTALFAEAAALTEALHRRQPHGPTAGSKSHRIVWPGRSNHTMRVPSHWCPAPRHSRVVVSPLRALPTRVSRHWSAAQLRIGAGVDETLPWVQAFLSPTPREHQCDCQAQVLQMSGERGDGRKAMSGGD